MDECKVCGNCGHQNDVSDTQCVNCEYDIIYIDPTPVSSQLIQNLTEENPAEILFEASHDEPTSPQECVKPPMTMPQIKLVNKKDNYEISIPFEGCVLGREGDVSPQYFDRNSDYVSRKHLKVFTRGNAYYVVDENSHNYTYINDQRLKYKTEQILNIGDTLRMADMEFLVV